MRGDGEREGRREGVREMEREREEKQGVIPPFPSHSCSYGTQEKKAS